MKIHQEIRRKSKRENPKLKREKEYLQVASERKGYGDDSSREEQHDSETGILVAVITFFFFNCTIFSTSPN